MLTGNIQVDEGDALICVDVATTCPVIVDRPFTSLRLRNLRDPKWWVMVDGEAHKDPRSLDIEMHSDDGFDALIEALRFAADELERQLAQNRTAMQAAVGE